MLRDAFKRRPAAVLLPEAVVVITTTQQQHQQVCILSADCIPCILRYHLINLAHLSSTRSALSALTSQPDAAISTNYKPTMTPHDTWNFVLPQTAMGVGLDMDYEPSECDSFRESGYIAGCDDLLDVDQQEISLITPPTSVHSYRSCLFVGMPSKLSPTTTTTECSLEASSSSTVTSVQSREKTLAQKIELVSKMERARRKLLLSMERSIQSRQTIKKRRLSADVHSREEEPGFENKAELSRKDLFEALQDRLNVIRRSSH